MPVQRSLRNWDTALQSRMVLNVILQRITQREVFGIELIEIAFVEIIDQPGSLVSDVVCFKRRTPWQFVLNPEISVLDVGLTNTISRQISDRIAIHQSRVEVRQSPGVRGIATIPKETGVLGESAGPAVIGLSRLNPASSPAQLQPFCTEAPKLIP